MTKTTQRHTLPGKVNFVAKGPMRQRRGGGGRRWTLFIDFSPFLLYIIRAGVFFRTLTHLRSRSCHIDSWPGKRSLWVAESQLFNLSRNSRLFAPLRGRIFGRKGILQQLFRFVWHRKPVLQFCPQPEPSSCHFLTLFLCLKQERDFYPRKRIRKTPWYLRLYRNR